MSARCLLSATTHADPPLTIMPADTISFLPTPTPQTHHEQGEVCRAAAHVTATAGCEEKEGEEGEEVAEGGARSGQDAQEAPETECEAAEAKPHEEGQQVS